MKINQYLASLLPSFTRDRLVEDVNLLREDLKNNSLKMYKQVSDDFGKKDFTTEYAHNFDALVKRDFDNRLNKPVYKVIQDILQITLDNLDVILNLIDHKYESDVLRDAMSAIRVNILQYIETATFFSRYARQHLVTAITAEVNKVTEQDERASMVPAELEWLNVHRASFITAMGILFIDKHKLEKTFDTLPAVLLNSETAETMSKVHGNDKLDPLQFGLIPTWLNPLYHVGMVVAEWQVSKYKASQEEVKTVEFQLMRLNKLATGKQDASLDRQLEYAQTRLQKLNRTIAQMENVK